MSDIETGTVEQANPTAPSAPARMTSPKVLAGIAAAAVVLIAIGVNSLNSDDAVFRAHPTYQGMMSQLVTVGTSKHMDYEWPYQGHQDELKVTFHADSFGASSSDAAPTKDQLDNAARGERVSFCAIRYRSGFTPDEAMNCQVYAAYENGSDTGYDGPGAPGNHDDEIKQNLNQLR